MEETLDLCEQLAQTDLSEDDTTVLLKEASDLNRRLKAKLKRIEDKERQNKTQKSMGRVKPSNSTTITSVDKHKKSFLPPISSTSVNEKTGNGSPYASLKSNNTRKVGKLSVNRQSSSAGNPCSASSKLERRPTRAIAKKTSHSADGVRTAHP